jgi:lipoyl(octanoyl) transferase
MNITPEPLKWFDLVLACGLADVRAVCLQDLVARNATNNGVMPTHSPSVQDVARGLLPRFGKVFGRELVELKEETGEVGEMLELVRQAELHAKKEREKKGGWATEPDMSKATL